MRRDSLPLTYDECRERFRRAADQSGAAHSAHPISARGPHGQLLTIDVARMGASTPRRALLVLSGVHGVEGFVNSALQVDLLGRIDTATLPLDVGVVLVHAVNPWGMSHDRRQNEHNVDLNRNWARSDREPDHNAAYEEIHRLACPDTPDLPPLDDMLASVRRLVEERGARWVEDAITRGQYTHPDGLHFGGDRTEQSCRVLEAVIPSLVGTAERLLTVDLHTGVGPWGRTTLLSSSPMGADEDVFLRESFGDLDVTIQNPSSPLSLKSGQIASGIADLLPSTFCVSTTVEFGTASDIEQLSATYQEQWVHRRGDLGDPAHRAARRRYRSCFTPDDATWEAQALTTGRATLDRAIAAVSDW